MKFNIYTSHFNGNPKNCYSPDLCRSWPQPSGRRLRTHLVWAHLVLGIVPADQCKTLAAGTETHSYH